jgi:antitoxin component YwqK of YwqJK toxin-antitoxin module
MIFDQGRRVHRSFSLDNNAGSKNVLREERVFESGEQPLNSTAGRLQTSKLWGANGQVTELVRYSEGRPTQTERWYLNGALKEKSSISGSGNSSRTQRERFSDDGKLASRETLTADGTSTGLQQYFYGNGKLRREETYGEPDTRGRTRVLARKEWDETGALTADDEILEDGSRKRK